ncbi:hypothetical protein M0R45_003381 [Rubus argutus]|uniref:Galactose oxidase n=1 Tax=Rubus argutus TaxID=59490 RepID=A0AAW1YHK9_RUBAR
MAALHIKLFCILPLLFISGINAQWPGFPFVHNPLISHRGFGFHPDFGNEADYQVFNPQAVGANAAVVPTDPKAAAKDGAVVPDPVVPADPKPAAGDGGALPIPANAGVVPADPKAGPEGGDAIPDAPPQLDFPTKYMGAWEVVSKDSGVSAMHLNLLPNNKIIMYDASAFHISNIKLPNGECLPFKDDKGVQLQDCWAHGVEYDADKNTVRPLKITTDPWCSSGGLTADGNMVSTGGWMDGTRTVRWMNACDNCDFKDYANALAEPRWYATQATLADGRFILVGGRKSFSLEYVPPEGEVNKQAIFLPLLDETTDLDENNLYPFVHVSTDGNIFILANSRSVLLDPKTNRVIKEFPKLEGGSRNYPASGMSAMLPIELNEQNPPLIPVDVIVCGGAKPEAYGLAGKGNFLPALDDCARLRITDPNPVWEKELMPSRRVMGDMLNLPTGDLLIISGAQAGTSAWFLAEQPNFTPVLYNPKLPNGQRFFNLQPTQIARMYHSSSALLPNGKILVAGSNTNPGYDYKAKYPTEIRVETFAPPYLDPALDAHRPVINVEDSDNKLKYGEGFGIDFKLNEADKVTKSDIKVTMYAPPFTTHGYSMNQRLLVLAKTELKGEGAGVYRVTVLAPPTSAVAPPGYYLVFVVHRGVPSVGMWVQIKL